MGQQKLSFPLPTTSFLGWKALTNCGQHSPHVPSPFLPNSNNETSGFIPGQPEV